MEEQDLKKFIEYDYYALPLFDGLQISFSKNELKKSGIPFPSPYPPCEDFGCKATGSF